MLERALALVFGTEASAVDRLCAAAAFNFSSPLPGLADLRQRAAHDDAQVPARPRSGS
jgi:hypothetical protein